MDGKCKLREDCPEGASCLKTIMLGIRLIFRIQLSLTHSELHVLKVYSLIFFDGSVFSILPYSKACVVRAHCAFHFHVPKD